MEELMNGPQELPDDEFLLSVQDLQDVSGTLGATDPKLPSTPNIDAPASGRQPDRATTNKWSDNSLLEEPNRSETPWDPSSNQAAGVEFLSMGDPLAKGHTEPGDSSEWEQSHEALLSQFPLVKNTDSPESALATKKNTSGVDAEELQPSSGVQAAEPGYGGATPFIRQRREDRAHLSGADLHVSASSGQPNQFAQMASDLTGLTPDPLGDLADTTLWDRRSSGAGAGPFHGSAFDGEFRQQNGGHGHGLYEGPSMGGSHLDGGLDARGLNRFHAAGSQPELMHNMHADPRGGGSYALHRRQFSGDMAYDMPRGMESLEAMLDQQAHMAQVEGPFGRPQRMSQGLQGRSSAFYSSQMPASDGVAGIEMRMADGPRKRMRADWPPQSPAAVPQSSALQQEEAQRSSRAALRTSQRNIRGRSLSNEENLILQLKEQIDHLDNLTKSTLKDSLYRISRNTNARVTGLGAVPPSGMSQRNGIVDRVVANLMYNRFATPQMRTNGQAAVSFSAGPRGAGSPGVQEGKPRRISESPNA